MIRRLSQLYYGFAYYLSWLWFGLGGLLLNLGCALLLPLPHRDRLGSGVRRAIRLLFRWWVKWFHASRVLHVSWIGFPDHELKTGTVYVANHPTLVDAPILLSVLPDTVCIFKSALLHNPCIGPAAIMAGYSSADTGVDMLRNAAEHVAAGRSLLIFPEGTRTLPGERLNGLKPGFALIAKRARAPIRVITIHASPRLVSRGVAWWKTPVLPGTLEIRLHEEIPGDTPMSAAEITAHLQHRLASLVGVVPSSASSCHDRTPTSC